MVEATVKWAAHAAAPNTHNRMLGFMQEHLHDLAGLSVCDVPCGAGAFSAILAELGMRVTALDLEAVEPFRFDEGKRILADANVGLPFGGEQFDVLVSIEGIEHLENPSYFLRECARVVKSGGWVFLSTPNVDSFRSRKYAFFRGYHRFFGPLTDVGKDACHLLPIDMVFLRGAAKKANLEIVDVTVNRVVEKTLFKELLRPMLVRKLPESMRGKIPFYGDVVIYALKKNSGTV